MPIKNFIIICFGLVLLFCSVLILKIPLVSQAMDGQAFCGSCHSMEVEIESYLHSSHRDIASCGDCHVPHEVISGSYYKAYTGAKDVLYTLAGETEDIKISSLGAEVVQKNCIECHGGTLSQIGNTMDNGRNCLECHASVRHKK